MPRRAATGQPPFYDVAVYHCQQAAEKAVKAFLVHPGKPYEKTHDIKGLVDLASEVVFNFSQLAGAAVRYAVSLSKRHFRFSVNWTGKRMSDGPFPLKPLNRVEPRVAVGGQRFFQIAQ